MTPGTKLGPYEILAPIGKGGMGEVWKARDTRLGRDVAIKISAEQFTERFEREAHAVAALNNPNICTLYDVGPNYLVMEYIEGATLAERIKEGPIPLDEALGIARHVADALDAAHEKNIIHRDLKPGNIKIKPDGTVKVLDFGLAKMGGTPTAGKAEDSPTLTLAATQAGMILGTAAYMSPEQARGKEVDKRADIWAFGVVLYEMVTGRKLFQMDDITDTLAAVLRHEPDWKQLPAEVRRLLKRCLEKDPKRRLRDIGDVWELLEETPPTVSAPPGGQSATRLGWVAAALALVAAVALWGWAHATRPIEQPLKPLLRLDVDLGPDVSLATPVGADAILSPDGTRLVYVSQNRLFTRRLDQPRAAELAGTFGAHEPFFSTDGQWIAFFAQGKLEKTSVEGGAITALCDAPNPAGGSWGEDGNIIAALGQGFLSRIPSAGGPPTPVTEVTPGETHRWPQILPGSKAVLFTTRNRSGEGGNIEVLNLADRHRKNLQRGGDYGRYVPSGHLLYINQGRLFAVAFDPKNAEIHGTAVPVLEGVAYSATFGSAQLDFSQGGTLLYRSGESTGLETVQWLDGTGKTQPLLAKPGQYARPRLSPDGRRLAIEVNGDVWIYEWERDILARLTFSGGTGPIWSPDGRFVAFQTGGISWIRSDGANKPQALTRSKSPQWPSEFTPDGRRLAFHEGGLGSGVLWTLPIENDNAGLRPGKPEVFAQSQFDQRNPAFSADGRWLAYASDESGTVQVYVRAFPETGGKWQVSSEGGTYPVWSRNGHELFFETLDNRIMVANYTAKGDSFGAEKPRLWSDKTLGGQANLIRNYDLSPDGKRIAALMPAEGPDAQQARNHVIFLENFFDELRRRVPITK